MQKTCIFCGKKPSQKTKEHIIPKWLIEITGPPGRKTFLGKLGAKEVVFPWMSFTFPACNQCNNDYSRLESSVKHIIQKILSGVEVSGGEFDELLDWFDKVRIGMWLGYSQLFGIPLNPNFHISQRTGVKDRLLVINKSSDNTKGIGVIGTQTPVFMISPSCFTLIINDYSFLNFSYESLVSKNLGFPYCAKYRYLNGKEREGEIVKGTGTVTRPILNGDLANPSIKIYQSINEITYEVFEESKKSNFIIENSIMITPQKIKSKLFVIDDNSGELGFIRNDTMLALKFSKIYPNDTLHLALSIFTHEHQNQCLTTLLPNLEALENAEKEDLKNYFNDALQINEKEIRNRRKHLTYA